jgi:hypothetical protein
MLLACLAAVLLAAAVAGPAIRLPADLASAERQAALDAAGATAADLCETGEGHAAHACPLCHKLPGADPIAAPDLTRPAVLTFHAAPHPADAPARRALNAHAPTRAPPAFEGRANPGSRQARTT